MNVHVLVTLRNLELVRASTMVFDTIRIGFPSAEIVPWDNIQKFAVGDSKLLAGAELNPLPKGVTIHHEWIEHLLHIEHAPFWICDTDVVFWDKVEHCKFDAVPMAGRYIPQFRDSFTKCITRPRLHTSLLWLNPQRIKEETAKYFSQFPETQFNPRPNLFYPMFHPVGPPELFGKAMPQTNYFYDTCSLLYHAIGGEPFTTDILDAYDHLNFGTISDLVCPHYPETHWRENHFAVFENPQLLKGAWKVQEQFYRANAA